MAQVQAWSAPGQQTMQKATVGFMVESSAFIDFKDGKGQERFVVDHVGVKKACQMICCPLCYTYAEWQGKNTSLKYHKGCGCCDCPFSVSTQKTDGAEELVGRTKKVGCCDNGCGFACCPCFQCSGHVKIMAMEDAQGAERFVLLKKLFACWPCVQAVAMGCAPLGIACKLCSGCRHYCSGDPFLTLTQPVYKGPWERSGDKEPEQMGEFVQSYRFTPVCCCLAVPSPMKFIYRPVEGGNLSPDDAVDTTLLAFVLNMYQGLPVPLPTMVLNNCCSFQKPAGVSCLDLGLNTEQTWQTLQEVMGEMG